ncbi:MAG: glycosyltransferase family 39 protein [Lentisphaeria bacterium]|nr:MAG: glycosyltransferase family 39 protein [Lentisphaeria bacterium]
MKPLSTSPVKLLHRHFELFLFAAALLLEFHIFHTARAAGLLAPPMPGMDQHTILQAALALPSGVLPEPGSYLYSPLYTLWLGGLAALTGGNLGAMRLLQGALAALIPAVIYRTGRKAGISRSAAEIGAILYLFCGSALLIALDFLRAAPLALLFLLFYNCLLGAWRSGTLRSWFLAGLCAGGCMLGRENFIAVALLPAIFLFAPSVRKRLTPGNAASAVAGSLLVLAPVLLYHLVTCGSPAILPGNGANVFRFFQGRRRWRILCWPPAASSWGFRAKFATWPPRSKCRTASRSTPIGNSSRC